MEKSNLKLEVFSIFKAIGDYSEVSINTPIFKMITGTDEQVELPIVTKGKDKEGNVVRMFEIDETKVYVRYNGKGAQFTNSIILKTEDAKRLYKGDNAVAFEF